MKRSFFLVLLFRETNKQMPSVRCQKVQLTLITGKNGS